MAQVRYEGEAEIEIPSLVVGNPVNKGDVIEVPDDFVVHNFSPVSGKVVKQTPVETPTNPEGGESK